MIMTKVGQLLLYLQFTFITYICFITILLVRKYPLSCFPKQQLFSLLSYQCLPIDTHAKQSHKRYTLEIDGEQRRQWNNESIKKLPRSGYKKNPRKMFLGSSKVFCIFNHETILIHNVPEFHSPPFHHRGAKQKNHNNNNYYYYNNNSF